MSSHTQVFKPGIFNVYVCVSSLFFSLTINMAVSREALLIELVIQVTVMVDDPHSSPFSMT